MMAVHWTYCGNHVLMYLSGHYAIHQMYIVLCVNYISVKLEEVKEDWICSDHGRFDWLIVPACIWECSLVWCDFSSLLLDYI